MTEVGEPPQGDQFGSTDAPAIVLPPTESIFCVETAEGRARTGKLLDIPTPRFVVLTGRGFALHLRQEVLEEVLPGKQMIQLPVGDFHIRQELQKHWPGDGRGVRCLWPHFSKHISYCSFRNPRLNPSVYGGEAACHVETVGGRRKVAPKDLLGIQQLFRADIVAAPAEEVPCDVVASRRLHRAANKSAEWLKELLEGKAAEEFATPWHVLAGVQGGRDLKMRQKACAAVAAFPVAGFWIGGLGYAEDLHLRFSILDTVTASLPQDLPRFLPLNEGSPVEMLQAVLLGVDVLEVNFPLDAAERGIALTFSWELPDNAVIDEVDEELRRLKEATYVPLLPYCKHLHLKGDEFTEDFAPISAKSPVGQYSRSYVHHLLGLRELLGTMLLVQHNLHVYNCFFEAIRAHLAKRTFNRFAAWFLRTQLQEAPPLQSTPTKKRKHN